MNPGDAERRLRFGATFQRSTTFCEASSCKLRHAKGKPRLCQKKKGQRSPQFETCPRNSGKRKEQRELGKKARNEGRKNGRGEGDRGEKGRGGGIEKRNISSFSRTRAISSLSRSGKHEALKRRGKNAFRRGRNNFAPLPPIVGQCLCRKVGSGTIVASTSFF